MLTPDLLLLALAALGAGFIDAVAGGGGLVQIPALLLSLPHEAPAQLLGTNKGASIFGTANAAWRYSRRLVLPWRTLLLPACIAAFAAALAGAATATALPKDTLRPLVLLLLLAVWLYTFRRPDFGKIQRTPLARPLLPALALCALIGFYDGFFGPGTGSFLIFVFVRIFGFDFLNASACAKIINAVTNLAALTWFVPHGALLWPLVAVMAICNIGGAIIGSNLALKHGSGFVRIAFLLVVGALILKLGIDVLG